MISITKEEYLALVKKSFDYCFEKMTTGHQDLGDDFDRLFLYFTQRLRPVEKMD